MKIGVVIFPGSNCDHDMIYSLQTILKQDVVEIWHKDKNLQDVDAIALPGGFSYGDYLRSGAIARFSPIMEKVVDFANKGGYVFGVCNGFQVLCETGLLPGALLHNTNQQFICKNQYIKPITNKTVFTSGLDTSKALKIPIAHGEGRYYAGKDVLQELHLNDQILFRYCDENAKVSEQFNPNGSVENIAGICNKNRNVFGMMPHPERAADSEIGNADGLLILKSLVDSL
ncbi:MAG: phosphoribosylformylglycinamidine synthase subunit PurQ [Bacteroidales bacterium]|nr:phosphoribosylformylglycinamidine synthase subunit PurQ [Bacteroidales bacterium]